MKSVLLHSFSLLFYCLLSGGVIATPDVHYKVSMDEPWTHYLHIEMRISGLDTDEAALKMAVWTPGSYMVREYARHIDQITAENSQGVQLEIHKTAKNAWAVPLQGNNDLVLRYSVYCFEHTVRTPFVDSDHASIIPAGVFIYLADYDGPLTVEIEPFKEWKKVTTALKQNSKSEFKFSADHLDHLLDSPIEIGNHTILEFDAAGIPHEVAIFGEGNFEPEVLKKDMTLIIEEATSLFGSNPNEHYTFIIHNTDDGYGGLEHLSSTSIIYRRKGYKNPGAYRVFLGLVSHEYIHLWNVKRIRPEALGPFNYDGENYTHGLWIAEGVTSYYDDLLLRRANITTEKDYLGIAAANMNSAGNRAGDRVQPVAHASFDAWIKYYRPDENSGNTTVSYYGKGAVLAMVLDVEILQLTNGKKRLDDVMKTLYQMYLKNPDRGFSDEEFQAVVEKIAGKDLDDFFRDYVYGTEVLPYAGYFEKIGVKVLDEMAGEPTIRLGAGINGSNVVTRVVRDMPAYKSGLNVNDEILSVNGYRYKGDIKDYLADSEDGDELRLLVSRDGKIREIVIALYPSPRYKYKLIPDEEASPKVRKLYQKWISLN